ncbi:MAG: PPC domain-containing protein [Sedimentisphaerales bacterium]|nr:PPC domain-containing protein [Sedimentisphaerales bacterium]
MLVVIDPNDGSSRSLLPKVSGISPLGVLWYDIAFHPSGTLYLMVLRQTGANTQQNEFYRVDIATGVATVVWCTSSTLVFCIDFGPDGRLYGEGDCLTRIDLVNRWASPMVSSHASRVTFWGMDFAPDGLVYAVSNGLNRRVYTIDPLTGDIIWEYGPYASDLCNVASQPQPDPDCIVLQNGVQIRGVADAEGGETFYKITIPVPNTRLEIVASGGTGDVDLYVRKGARPTASEWDYRPYLKGNDETVATESQQATTYYIMLKGYLDYSDVTLKATYIHVFPLQNGVTVTGIVSDRNDEKVYAITVPEGQNTLKIESDLLQPYVKRGSPPTTTAYDYYDKYAEGLTIVSPPAGIYYIMLEAQDPQWGGYTYTAATLKATYADIFTLQNGVVVCTPALAKDDEVFYAIAVPSGQDCLTVEVSEGFLENDTWGTLSGVTWYVREGARPTTEDYDRQPVMRIGWVEPVTIMHPKAATYYIMLRGLGFFRGCRLKATYTQLPPTPLQSGVTLRNLEGYPESEAFYSVTVPGPVTELKIATTGSDDVDLYVRKGSKPNEDNYDYRAFTKTGNETVTILRPMVATYYIMLKAQKYQDYSGVTLTATWPSSVPVTVLQSAVAVTTGRVGELYFAITVPPGQTRLDVTTSGGTGDVDLYVRNMALPGLFLWDGITAWDGASAIGGSNDETVTITNPQAGTYYILLRACCCPGLPTCSPVSGNEILCLGAWYFSDVTLKAVFRK